MALLKCPECGKKVSDTCSECIHCGFKLKKVSAEPQKKRSIWGTIFWVILFIVMVRACVSDEKTVVKVQKEEDDYHSLSERSAYNKTLCLLGLGIHDLYGSKNYHTCLCKEMSETLDRKSFEKVVKCADTKQFELCIRQNFASFDWYEIAKKKCGDY